VTFLLLSLVHYRSWPTVKHDKQVINFMFNETQTTDTYGTFLKSISGVILLASPSQGSTIATVASPLAHYASSLSGGLSTLIRGDHLAALKPSSAELQAITHDFDAFCACYESQLGRRLKLAALREGVMASP
jgi:hypothetical protein